MIVKEGKTKGRTMKGSFPLEQPNHLETLAFKGPQNARKAMCHVYLYIYIVQSPRNFHVSGKSTKLDGPST